jgi:hypothetical protein
MEIAVGGLAAAVVNLVIICAYLWRHLLRLRQRNRELEDHVRRAQETAAALPGQLTARKPRRLNVSGKLPVQQVSRGAILYTIHLN